MNLIDVVQACCDVLRSSAMKKQNSANKQCFLESAWDLITCLAYEIIDTIDSNAKGTARPIPDSRPVEVVPVETSLFAQILLARRRNVENLKDQVYSGNSGFAKGKWQIPFQGKDPKGNFSAWESGPNEDDAIVEFERLLWPFVFKGKDEANWPYQLKCEKKRCNCKCDTPGCCRKLLYSRLRTADKDECYYVITEKSENTEKGKKCKGSQLQHLAASFTQIAFVELSGSQVLATTGIDENDFARLIAKLLNFSN